MLPKETSWIARPKYVRSKIPQWTNENTQLSNVTWDVPLKSQFPQPDTVLQAFVIECKDDVYPLLENNVHRDVFVLSADSATFYSTIKEMKLDVKTNQIVETDNDVLVATPLEAGQGFSFDPTKPHHLVGMAVLLIVDRKDFVTLEDVSELLDENSDC